MLPPYGVIWNGLRKGLVVPFLGAGASMIARATGTLWDAERPSFLPSGRELSNFLASETEFPVEYSGDADDLAKVTSYYAVLSGRSVLRKRLRELLNHGYQCGPLHRFLAEVPAHQVIVVTNYDTLVEQAFREAGKPFDLVIHPADRKDIANAVLWWRHNEAEPAVVEPNALDIDLAQTTVIYKMHGTLHPETDKWDNFVITEEDYVDFLSRMTASTAIPSLLYRYFRERSFLFLGYGLRDWNLRVVLNNLNRYLAKRSGEDVEVLPSWAIQRSPSELERKLWDRRNVSIFDLDLDEFVNQMRRKVNP